MTLNEVRQKYLAFFSDKIRKHVVIPSASLVPENDPTTLFTGSGMQSMLPYLLGEKHPLGIRIADSQKCFRSGDIEEVGDNRHTTFFEMLGNWSLGDPSTGVRAGYWKEEQLSWLFEFLTKELHIKKERLWVTCFEGDKNLGLPKDEESAGIWKKIGMAEDHICFYGTKKNWWSRSGVPENMPVGEPGGPDSEIFYDFGTELGLHEKSEWKNEKCHPNCDCGRFMEIGNSVFMEYRKIPPAEDGSAPFTKGRMSPHAFDTLRQRNVDFGGGLERITAAANNEPDVFKLDVFGKAIKNLEAYTEKIYQDDENKKSYRIVLDHIRAAVFLMADGIMPSNVDKGYFVRRLLRRAILHLDNLQMDGNQLHNPLDSLVNSYKAIYPKLLDRKREIEGVLNHEEQQFRKTLSQGKKRMAQIGFFEFDEVDAVRNTISHGDPRPEDFFDLYTTYGFPPELVFEDLAEKQRLLMESGYMDEPWLTEERRRELVRGFQKLMMEHNNSSRAGAEQKFKGGLADHSEQVVKYHTATHLLHQALREVLGTHVGQKGSNITAERLRFDFTHPTKMTPEEIKKVEAIVNEKIKAALPVQKVVLPLAEAEKTGALHFFGEKYPDQVNVYFIGDSLATAFSKEFCGGPHVTNTSEISHFKIAKEEAVSAGIRRIKAVVA